MKIYYFSCLSVLTGRFFCRLVGHLGLDGLWWHHSHISGWKRLSPPVWSFILAPLCDGRSKGGSSKALKETKNLEVTQHDLHCILIV